MVRDDRRLLIKMINTIANIDREVLNPIRSTAPVQLPVPVAFQIT